MLYNNLSRRQAPSLLIRVDNNLVRFREEGLKDKILNAIKGDYNRADVSDNLAKEIGLAFRYTDYRIDLVVLKKYASEDLIDYLDTLPIGELKIIDEPIEIANMLNAKEYLFYVDDNQDNCILVNHHACITTETLHQILKGGSHFE